MSKNKKRKIKFKFNPHHPKGFRNKLSSYASSLEYKISRYYAEEESHGSYNLITKDLGGFPINDVIQCAVELGREYGENRELDRFDKETLIYENELSLSIKVLGKLETREFVSNNCSPYGNNGNGPGLRDLLKNMNNRNRPKGKV